MAAKPFLELKDSDYHADKSCKNANARATKGQGRTQPAEWQDAGEVLGNDALKGVHMPKGLPKELPWNDFSLYYNEVGTTSSSYYNLLIDPL